MKTILTMLSMIFFLNGYSQTIISGQVAGVSGKAIVGANVYLLDTYDGVSSGADGTFEFKTSETGSATLVVKFIGYKDFQQSLEIGDNAPIKIIMEEMVNELDAVMITAGSFTAGDASRRTVFKALDIATTAGATADIAGALNTLPGTQKVGETGRLFVRGGDGTETRTFIDGMVVLDAYNTSAPNTPSRGRFLPFMFKGTSFSTGGYSAEYGQALSSALVLDSKDKAESTPTDIGILSVGGDVAHTQAWDRGSVAGKVQYTNISPYFGLINQEVDWEKPPESIEAVSAFRQQVGNGMLKVYGNFNHSNFSMFTHSIDNYDVKALHDLTNNFRYLNGSYQCAANKNWSIRSGLSYTFIENDTHINADDFYEKESGVHAKVVAEGSLSDKTELRTGAEIIQRHYRYNTDLDAAGYYGVGFDEWIFSGFAEADIRVGENFVARPGLRIEYDNLIHKTSADPRISLAYKVASAGQVSFAYGRFRQSPTNEWLRVNRELDSEKAEHFILNYQFIENNRTFRVETYYKRYRDLVKFSDGYPSIIYSVGEGYAKGVELFWRDNRSIKNVDYWISYSYLNTKRDYLNFPYPAAPSFASAHNLSMVYKHFVRLIKCQLGFTYSVTSGRPYNDPNSEKFNTGKTPIYSDLSANVAYLPRPFLILYVSCTNLLGRDNIFGYEYSVTPDNNGYYNSRPVRQAAPRFLFVGIFITLSKDKSVNQLPSL